MFFAARHYRAQHTEGYTSNNKNSKKAIMWLLQMEQSYVVVIKHAGNGRE